MTINQVLLLLLALSVAVNIGFAAGWVARTNGKSLPTATLIGGSAVATTLTVFFAAVAAYR